MGTAIKHSVPVPAQVKPSFCNFWHPDTQPWASEYGWASECPDVKRYTWLLNPVWHRMLYSCTYPYCNSGRQRVNGCLAALWLVGMIFVRCCLQMLLTGRLALICLTCALTLSGDLFRRAVCLPAGSDRQRVPELLRRAELEANRHRVPERALSDQHNIVRPAWHQVLLLQYLLSYLLTYLL